MASSAAAATTGRRTFRIVNNLYSAIDGMILFNPYSRLYRSAVFTVGGYDWCIRCDPFAAADVPSIGFFLQLVSRGARARASFGFSLLDVTANLPPWPLPTTEMLTMEFDGDDLNNNTHGYVVPKWWLTDEAPGFGFFLPDGFTIECTVTVFPAAPPRPFASAAARAAPPRVKVPPSDMMAQLGAVYAAGDGADVTFSVAGKLFRAHRIILAMRSPVFMAELYGGMMESTAALVEVQEMQAAVFEALLRYIYTDALPDATSLGLGCSRSDMMQHLLVAADRYGVERLKLMCEQELCDGLHAGNVAAMLAFADDHQCDTLKDACIWFIGTTDRTNEVVESEAYAQLRSDRPGLLVEVLEKLRLKW
ncbi:hypothetical protein ACP4OV_026982 [Aristida adscensionis]